MLIEFITFPFRYSLSKLKKWLGKLEEIKIEALYAFGNENIIYFKGRVLETYRQSKPSARKNYFQNILAAFRRYAGSSVVDAKVLATYQHQKLELESDSEGIISGTFVQLTPPDYGKELLSLSLIPEEGLRPERKKIQITIQQFPSTHPTGIISDIDDTILISHATDVGKKLWLAISKNAYTRRPFPGVSDFYKALSKDGINPIFYVSSSDWNLYDLIMDFMHYRNIPKGPLFLKDLRVDLRNIWKSGGGSHQHKKEKIEMIFNIFSGMKFILIGDSGQHDPEIYADIVAKYPGRILVIYIRELKNWDAGRNEDISKILEENHSPEMVLVKSTSEAMEHAKHIGLIN